MFGRYPDNGSRIRLGLRGIFILVMTVVLLLVLSLYLAEDIKQRSERMRSEMRSDVEVLARFVALVAPEAILGYDFLSLNNQMRELSQHRDVVYAVILHGQRPLTTYLNRQRPQVQQLQALQGDETDLRTLLPELRSLVSLEVLSLPITAAGKSLATIEVGISLARMDEESHALIVRGVGRGLLLLLVLSAIIYVVFRRYVVIPLQAILTGIERGFHGSGRVPVRVVRHDELGQVATALNRMMGDVMETHADLLVQKNQIRLLLDSTAEGIIGSDGNGRATFVNQAGREMLGFSESEIIGSDLHRYLKHDHAEHSLACDCPVFRSALGGAPIHEEDSHLVTASDSLIPVEYWLRPMHDGKGVVGVILTFVDISGRKHAEELLQATLETLDDQVQERTLLLNNKLAELERTRSELMQTEKMASLGRLVAGFSHEINTPIGIALGGASHIEEEGLILTQMLQQEEVTEEALAEVIQRINEAAGLTANNLQRAAALVTSFKRTAIDQSSEALRLFDMCDSLSDVVTSLHNSFKRTPIEISVECEEGLQLYGRPGLIDQLITNLMLNSLNHAYGEGKEGGTLSIRVWLESGVLRIGFSDDGRGMDPATLERVFEPFFTTARGNGGSGLGLFICYNIVTTELHGTITVESQIGKGTRFDIHIPMGSESEG